MFMIVWMCIWHSSTREGKQTRVGLQWEASRKSWPWKSLVKSWINHRSFHGEFPMPNEVGGCFRFWWKTNLGVSFQIGGNVANHTNINKPPAVWQEIGIGSTRLHLNFVFCIRMAMWRWISPHVVQRSYQVGSIYPMNIPSFSTKNGGRKPGNPGDLCVQSPSDIRSPKWRPILIWIVSSARRIHPTWSGAHGISPDSRVPQCSDLNHRTKW